MRDGRKDRDNDRQKTEPCDEQAPEDSRAIKRQIVLENGAQFFS